MSIKISELDPIIGNDLSTTDQFVVVDASVPQTKSVTFLDLNEALTGGAVADIDDVSALLVDTALTYAAGNTRTVAAGDIIRTRAEGFAYEVAASGATDQHVTTAGGVKLYVLEITGGGFNVKAFGAVGDGVTDDTATIQAAIDSIDNATHNGRGGTTRIVFPEGEYRTTSSITVDGVNVTFIGDDATIQHAGADPAFDLGQLLYLNDFVIASAYRTVEFENLAIEMSNAAAIGVRNRGVRRLKMRQVFVEGGDIGVQSEAAFSGSWLQSVVCQSQVSRSFDILKRNNLFLLEKCVALSGATVGFYISTEGGGSAGENHNITLINCDSEGCVTGYQVSGDNVGPVLFQTCWAENNTGDAIYAEGAAATNTYAVRIYGGQFDSDVVFGQAGGGRLRGCLIEGASMSNANIRVWEDSGVEIGYNQFLGTSALVFESGQPLSSQGFYAAAERMPLFEDGHGVPTQTADTRGKTGELRWDETFAYIKKSPTEWQRTQVSEFGGSVVPDLPTGVSPDVIGLHVCRTNNDAGPITITSFTNGEPGQELIIIGSDSGNTTVQSNSNIKLPGGTSIILGNNDTVHLVCLRNDANIWVCVSNSDNPA